MQLRLHLSREVAEEMLFDADLSSCGGVDYDDLISCIETIGACTSGMGAPSTTALVSLLTHSLTTAAAVFVVAVVVLVRGWDACWSYR